MVNAQAFTPKMPFLPMLTTLPNVTDGLVGWWKMDETTSPFQDSGGAYNNYGTWSKGATYTNGFIGNGGYFDGITNYLAVDYSTELRMDAGATLSIFAWVYRTSPPISDYSSVIDFRNLTYVSWELTLNNTGEPRQFGFYNGTTFTISEGGIPTNQWYHIGVVLDGSGGIYYTNGVAAGTTAANVAAHNNQTAIHIGAVTSNNIDTWGQFFKGILDDVRVYNRDLSESEVQTIYQWRP